MSTNVNCDVLSPDDKTCTRWRRTHLCEPSDASWLDQRMETCEMNQMCRHSSIFGNCYFYLTDEDIEALKSGKVLFYVDEYGVFIGYEPGEKEL